MGAGKTLTRVVLDTNVLVSALLFGGRMGTFRDRWRKGRLRPVLCRETADELVRVLAYPKFRLTKKEIGFLLESEVLPYAEVIEIPEEGGAWSRDPDDDKFIRCALAGKCSMVVTGDEDLLSLRQVGGTRILSPAEYLAEVSPDR